MMRWNAAGWLRQTRWLASPNHGPRPVASAVSLIVLHSISLPPGEFAGQWVEAFFCNRLPATHHPYFAEIAEQQVSAHFYVQRDGRVIQFVSTDRRAWHAGVSSWQGQANCNDYSVGIELAGSDCLPFAPAQYAALFALINALRQRYPIRGVQGHCHIAPGRKTDPGPYFDWAALAERYPALTLPPKITA